MTSKKLRNATNSAIAIARRRPTVKVCKSLAGGVRDTVQPSLHLEANFKEFRHRAANSSKRLSALLITHQLLQWVLKLRALEFPGR
jgi:hypothetical protein